MTFAGTRGLESLCRQRRERNNACRQSQRLADGHSADANATVVEPSGLVIEWAYRYSGWELLMGDLDDITDTQLQSWIDVTRSTMDAEVLKIFGGRKGPTKRFCATRRHDGETL